MVRSDASAGRLPGASSSRSVGDRTASEPNVVQWPAAREPVSEPGGPHPARYCYLLDADPDLADAFDIRTRLVVRQVATARVVDVAAGPGWVEDPPGPSRRGLGLLVLDGLFAVDVRVGGRTASELLGPGDLLQPPRPSLDELLDREVIRRTLSSSRVAVLDGEFLDRVRAWPDIVLTLLQRAEKRAIDLDLQRAVSSHPSLELRLGLLLWHLAERWGRVEPGGIHLELPLTHALLGRLIAAERPSVSRSLARLAEHGLVTGGAGDWHLIGSAEGCLNELLTRSVERLHPDHEIDSTA
jgi:CRP/FNR family transcriptional regulator, cyclic AMP receptor protein